MRWDVDAIVQAWASGQPNHGLQVRAVDEADSLTWRRFRSANYVDGSQGPTEPTLVVTYNTKPPGLPGEPRRRPGHGGHHPHPHRSGHRPRR